ncbi:MAG: stage V sporulation protein AC [Symbiobacteriia bacterium]
MSGKKPLTVEQMRYQALAKRHTPKPPVLRHAVTAFVAGGIVSLVGQFLTNMYGRLMHLPPDKASNPAVVTVILIAAILTGFGVYDRLAKVAGAGLAVPVTGFANSIVSEALEFKKEGLVYGVGGKMFTLAGSVIVFGVVTAFVVGLISAVVK